MRRKLNLKNGIEKSKRGRKRVVEVHQVEEAGLEAVDGLDGLVKSTSGRKHNKQSLQSLALFPW